MLRFAADENFNNDVLRGVLRRNPTVDIVRVQDAELSGAGDPEVLEWAAAEGRVVLTHDVATMGRHAWDRTNAGRPMPGVFHVAESLPLGDAIDDILLLAEASEEGEWEGEVHFLPL